MYSLAIFAAAVLLPPAAKALSLNTTNGTAGYTSYSTVTGYFLQDDAATNASIFSYVRSSPSANTDLTPRPNSSLIISQTATSFGLKNHTYPGSSSAGNLTQWQRFAAIVNELNANAELNTVYKVLFMGRHGEGYHNAAESFYGTPAWNCYWSELTGNSTVSWSDADLTPAGIAQAQIANAFWRSQIATQHTPYPQSYYTSPLTRCLRTANLTFSNLDLPHYYPFVPTVKELFREGISTHTCDHRRSKTYIASLFPSYSIEPGLAETDPYWNGHTGEPAAAQDIRSKRVLDDVFANDDHTWISITSHSGEIASLLRVLGHRVFSLSTGAVIPVLVKAQFVADGPVASAVPFTSSAYCASPPVTSVSGVAQGCVCAATATETGVVSATATATGNATMSGY